MPDAQISCHVIAGPNSGDTVAIDVGQCRLIGRHLSETETTFIDRDGNRMLDAAASDIISEHLRGGQGVEKSQDTSQPVPDLTSTAFKRGPDVIFADDAISRAHAMLFYDTSGMGIIDLASTNGVLVNGKRIVSTMLHPKDVIRLGSSELQVTPPFVKKPGRPTEA